MQLVAEDLDPAADPEAIALTAADVPEMLELTERTSRGRSCRGRSSSAATGASAARAGWWRWPGSGCARRASPRSAPSAPTRSWRGHGFAARLTRAVAAGITARGETPFLHAAGDNANAIRLYKALGFVHRRQVFFVAAKSPE